MDLENPSESPSELEYYKRKLVIDIVRDVSGNLDRPLREKLRKMFSDADLSFYLNLHREGSGVDHRINNIFGLSPPALEELTFSEQKLLQSEVERYIIEKYPKQFQLFDEMLGTGQQRAEKLDLSQEQNKLLELSDIYLDKLNCSVEQLGRMCDLMVLWMERRLKDMVERMAVTTHYYLMRNKLLEMKAKIIEVQLSLTVYSGSAHSGSGLAYMEVNKDITKKIDALKSEMITYRNILSEAD